MSPGSLVRITACCPRAVVTTTASTTSAVPFMPDSRPASCASISPRGTTTHPVRKRRSWARRGDRLTWATTGAGTNGTRPSSRRALCSAHALRWRSCRTPDGSRYSDLRPHAAASFIHLFCGEASVPLLPQRDGLQTSAPVQCFARRGGHPGGDAHFLASGRRNDVIVNARVYGDGKAAPGTAESTEFGTAGGFESYLGSQTTARFPAFDLPFVELASSNAKMPPQCGLEPASFSRSVIEATQSLPRILDQMVGTRFRTPLCAAEWPQRRDQPSIWLF
jgi:hypothetical protein